MKNKLKKFRKAFTLIEVMVVISIISLLSSIVIVTTNIVKAKGNDATTISQVHQVQTGFQSGAASSGANMPNPADSGGDSNHYYCVGKSSADNCQFWGTAIDGNDAVQTGLVAGGFTGVPRSAPIVIDGISFNGYAYKCASIADGRCLGALYWTQSLNTPCTIGAQVYEGVGGRVCAEDVGGGGINNVDMTSPLSSRSNGGGGNTTQPFVYSLSQPADVSFSVEHLSDGRGGSLGYSYYSSLPQTSISINYVSGPVSEPVRLSTSSYLPNGVSVGFGFVGQCTPNCVATVTVSVDNNLSGGVTGTFPVVVQAVSNQTNVSQTTSFNIKLIPYRGYAHP
jgi:prepilin-type N-terminal cleavage/methylation domain-containing protein